ILDGYLGARTRAQVAVDTGKFQEAIDALSHFIPSAGYQNATDLTLRALAHVCIGNTVAAWRDVQACIDVGKTDAFATLGEMLLKMDRLEEADGAFSTGVAINAADDRCCKGQELVQSCKDVAVLFGDTAAEDKLKTDAQVRHWLRDDAAFAHAVQHVHTHAYSMYHSNFRMKIAHAVLKMHRAVASLVSGEAQFAWNEANGCLHLGKSDVFAVMGDMLHQTNRFDDAVQAYEAGLSVNKADVVCIVGVRHVETSRTVAEAFGHESLAKIIHRLVENPKILEWLKDKENVQTLEAVQLHPFKFTASDPQLQLVLKMLQTSRKIEPPMKDVMPNEDITKEIEKSKMPLVFPTFTSLEDVTSYIMSYRTLVYTVIVSQYFVAPSTEWPLQDNYRMYSRTIGSGNHTVFHAVYGRQRSKMVVKLTHEKQELDFIDGMKQKPGHENYLVECFKWGLVNVAGYDCYMLVMECGRGNLYDQLHRLQSDRFLRLRCMEDVAKAVDFLHQHNYIHGDLKLENIVDFGPFKLIDFDHTIQMGAILPRHCTYQYCPPELAQYLRCDGPAVVASASFDVWCLGVLALKLFVKDGILVEFDGLYDETILDEIAAPGFSFQRSLLAANLSDRQLSYLSQCLEPNPAKRATSAATILKMVDMKEGVTATVAPVVVEEVKDCDLPCFWTLTIPRRRIPTGNQLRLMSCTLGMLPEPSNSGCTIQDVGDGIAVQADSVVVHLVRPFLKAMRLMVELVNFLTDEGAADGLPFPTFLSFESIDKTIQALDTIHDASTPQLAVEIELTSLVDRIETDGPTVDVARLRLDFIQVVQSFQQLSDTRTRVAELFDAIAANTPEAASSLFGYQKSKNGNLWLCPAHSCADSVSTLIFSGGWPCVWTVLTSAKSQRWKENDPRWEDETFHLAIQCEMSATSKSCSSEGHILSREMQFLALPILKASYAFLQCLVLAKSTCDLSIGHYFQYNLKKLNLAGKCLGALEAMHESVLILPTTTKCLGIFDKLNNPELDYDGAQLQMGLLRKAFFEFRSSVEIESVLKTIRQVDPRAIDVVWLHNTCHVDGNDYWVCQDHAHAP
ncbi:hypothetical protein As57867_004240, partial [Aphanomyces stellatus]